MDTNQIQILKIRYNNFFTKISTKRLCIQRALYKTLISPFQPNTLIHYLLKYLVKHNKPLHRYSTRKKAHQKSNFFCAPILFTIYSTAISSFHLHDVNSPLIMQQYSCKFRGIVNSLDSQN